MVRRSQRIADLKEKARLAKYRKEDLERKKKIEKNFQFQRFLAKTEEKASVFFERWPDLPDVAKNAVISKMDYRTRRNLRACARKERELVAGFHYAQDIFVDCRFCPNRRQWYCNASHKLIYDRTENLVWFDSREEAYAYMQTLIRSSNGLGELRVDTERNAPLQLMKGQNLLRVSWLVLRQIDFEDNEVLSSCTQVLMQLDPAWLRRVKILTIDERSTNCRLDNVFYEKNDTYFKLESFYFHGIVNIDTLHATSSFDVKIFNGSEITANSLVRFLQKQILRNRENRLANINIRLLSPEMQTYLLGNKELKMMRLDLFFKSSERYMLQMTISRGTDGDIKINVQHYNPTWYNKKPEQVRKLTENTLGAFPKLNMLLHDVSEGLPRNYQLFW